MKNHLEKIKIYCKQNFKHDLLAGIIVGLIALPLAIAFAVASGARPEQGLYTSIIAGILIGTLSGSKFQISGPTGAFIVILLGIVNKFQLDGLLIAGFMAGIILLLMGIFQLGSIIKYIPYPVTIGFTSGIGVIIFSGQIKDFLGLKFDHRPEGIIETFHLLIQELAKGFNITSIIIGTITLITFLIWKKYNKQFPPAPIALTAGIITSLIISKFFNQALPTPILVGEIPSGLPQLTIPPFSWEKIIILIPSALTIAMLGAIESLLSAVVADGMTGTKHNSNKELIAQGIGNMVLPFFNGIPATGAIARTAANIRNGARTRIASIIHGVVLLIILLVAAPFAGYIPMAALATILMMVAYNMAEIPHFIRLLKYPKEDALVLVTTFLLTIFMDLTIAVGIGIVLAALLFIKRLTKLWYNKIFEDPEGIESEGSKRIHSSIREYPQIHLYELAGPLFFGVAAEMENVIEHESGEILILRMKHVFDMDASAINALEVIIKKALKDNGKIFLSTLNKPLHQKLKKVGIIEKIGGEEYITNHTSEAIEKAKTIIASQQTKHINQHLT